MNPDLLPPPQATPSSVARVSPLPRFKTKLEDGTYVESTAPLGITKVEPKHYVCTVPAASMFRHDGKKLPFVHGFLTTNLKEDQDYLDYEIHSGNTYLREATAEEVHVARMRADPRGTIREELRPEVEAEVASRFETEIKALQDKINQLTGGEPAKVEPGSVGATNVDAEKIAGTGSTQDKLAALRAGLKDGTVKKGSTATVIMESKPAPLQGIVGSDKTVNAAAEPQKK
jgi:hypothetical protein